MLEFTKWMFLLNCQALTLATLAASSEVLSGHSQAFATVCFINTSISLVHTQN